MDKITRLSVNINADAAAALKELAGRRHVSVTEVIRRAIAIYKFVEDETAKGNRIQVVDKKNQDVREVVMV